MQKNEMSPTAILEWINFSNSQRKRDCSYNSHNVMLSALNESLINENQSFVLDPFDEIFEVLNDNNYEEIIINWITELYAEEGTKQAKVYMVVQSLSDREKRILSAIIIEKYKFVEMPEIMGISERWARAQFKRIMNKIEDALYD